MTWPYGSDFTISDPAHWKLYDRVITSLDKVKGEGHLPKLMEAEGWDLVIFDEAPVHAGPVVDQGHDDVRCHGYLTGRRTCDTPIGHHCESAGSSLDLKTNRDHWLGIRGGLAWSDRLAANQNGSRQQAANLFHRLTL